MANLRCFFVTTIDSMVWSFIMESILLPRVGDNQTNKP